MTRILSFETRVLAAVEEHVMGKTSVRAIGIRIAIVSVFAVLAITAAGSLRAAPPNPLKTLPPTVQQPLTLDRLQSEIDDLQTQDTAQDIKIATLRNQVVALQSDLNRVETDLYGPKPNDHVAHVANEQPQIGKLNQLEAQITTSVASLSNQIAGLQSSFCNHQHKYVGLAGVQDSSHPEVKGSKPAGC